LKTFAQVDEAAKTAATTSHPLIKVCMHVLERARTDARVMREATALVEAGFAVSIVDVESESSCPLQEYIHDVCVNHIRRPDWFIPTRFKPWFLVKYVLMIICSAWRLVRSPVDIYHAQDQKSLPACYIAAWIRRKPLIFDAHELPLSDVGFTRWRRLHALSEHFLANMLPSCAGIITVSSPIEQEICKRYSVSNVHLIRNVPVYRTVPKSDRLRQHLGLIPAVRIALYQGYLQPDRGLDRLIHAAAFLEQNIFIVLLGQGPQKTVSQLEALIVSEGVTDRIKILPAVPYEELLDWTASADIGLHIPSPDYSLNTRWALPNKLFEYLMAGIPVLTSELDAIVEVIKTYDVGQVVSSLAPEDLGAAISAMLDDYDALARMRHNALEAARQEFHWEKESQRLIDLYHSILEVHKKASN
jgi:glycosyltransferase involved in cell wall biosynthesis